jgi:hypothetical protein
VAIAGAQAESRALSARLAAINFGDFMAILLLRVVFPAIKIAPSA